LIFNDIRFIAMSKAIDSLAEMSQGAFKRSASVCRDFVSARSTSQYPAAASRYRLYVSYACPWASRCLAFLSLKGLEDAIPVSVVEPIWGYTKPGEDEHRGWVFQRAEHPDSDATDDPVFHAKTLRELYEKAGSQSPKFTVPVLLDTETKKIVNNESADILRMFNSEFNAFAKHPGK
jgi:putative glutathione S-transferase